MNNLSNENLEYLKDKLENLRTNILDFSRSNPLINTRMGTTTQSYLRVIDEQPEIIFYGLQNGQEFELLPLPNLDDEPKDEQNHEFEKLFEEKLVTEKEYLKALQELQEQNDTSQDSLYKIQRDLKDRIRDELKLPPRQKKDALNIRQHAKNNNIDPNYDLPSATNYHDDGRHEDNKIQTLLLPKDLERLAGRIFSKGRSSEMEFGVNPLHAAFGFLEWIDLDGEKENLSPIIIIPIEIRKTPSSSGAKFFIKSTGENASTNRVLKEKFKLEHKLDFPDFDGSSVEDYFKKISNLKPQMISKWELKRFINFGNFPSAQMSMYNDLKFENHDYEANSTIQDLLIGKTLEPGDQNFAPDYPADEPKFENEVPHLVLDADSSQFSALVDIQRGKDLSIEGPPGTGKSQTIVNAIIAAISSGKKVLFVAQKLAALEVVLARIKSLGLDDFVLPLQDTRTSRGKLIESIKKRIQISKSDVQEELGIDYSSTHLGNIEAFRKAREDILLYLDILKSEFIEGYTVFDIFSKNIKLGEKIDSSNNHIKISNTSSLNKNTINLILTECKELKEKHSRCSQDQNFWSKIKIEQINKFVVDDIINKCSEIYKYAENIINNFSDHLDEEFRVNQLLEEKNLNLLEFFSSIKENLNEIDFQFLTHVLENEQNEILSNFIKLKQETQVFLDKYNTLFNQNINQDLYEKVKSQLNELEYKKLTSLDKSSLEEELKTNLNDKDLFSEKVLKIKNFFLNTKLEKCSFNSLQKAYSLIKETKEEVLHLRNEEYENPIALDLITGAIEKVNEIKKLREKLEPQFYMDRIPNSEVLIKNITYLKNSSMLSRFSSDHKEAQSLFEKIVKRNKFTKVYALKFFQELLNLKELEENLFSNEQLKLIVGKNFNNIDTDFENIEKSIMFIRTLNQLFTNIEDQSLLNFLKKEPINILNSIPEFAIDDISKFENFDALSSYMNEIEDLIEEKKIKIQFIENNFHFLNDKENCNLNSLKQFLENFTEFNEKNLKLNELSSSNELKDFNTKNLNEKEVQICFKIISKINNSNINKQEFINLVSENSLKDKILEIENFNNLKNSTLNTINEFFDFCHLENIFLNKNNISFKEIFDLFSKAASERAELESFAYFNKDLSNFNHPDVLEIIENQLKTTGDLKNIEEIVEAIIFKSLIIEVYHKHGNELSGYSGSNLSNLRNKVRELDEKIIKSSSKQVKLELIDNCNPPAGNGVGRPSTYTEMSLLNHEVEKKSNFKAPRFLLDKAGNALSELKPCWMMPPLNISKYLKPDMSKFDLCIIDEASQMIPGFALGALLRSKQCIIVGDVNQMPPDRSFSSNLSDIDDDEDLELEESVLDMSNKIFHPLRRLRWHYRSEHSSLISFSNRHIYDDQLILFPSSNENTANIDMGVSLIETNGLYSTGLNITEAEKIVQFTKTYIKKFPERSLGIVTMNIKQSDHIESLFFKLQNDDKSFRDYVEYWDIKDEGLQRFIVKNVASIQGDERDTILISTVYGPEKPGGSVKKRFGPINGISGKRRLNVLFSRAKKQMITFTSMKPSDLQGTSGSNEGVILLSNWLEYSKTGKIDSGQITGKKADSDFEIFVMEQIEKLGFIAEPQIGVAGYFIDIGVKHKDWEYGYIIGVECDGRQYHSSRSARDRDRIRQNILEELGWSFHRIWSTDWFNNKDEEIKRLKKRLDQRLNDLKSTKPKEETIEELKIQLKKEEELLIKESESDQDKNKIIKNSFAEIGDTVTVQYLDNKTTFKFTITEKESDIEKQLMNYNKPIAKAVLDKDIDDEVEVLAGVKLRKAIILDIHKMS